MKGEEASVTGRTTVRASGGERLRVKERRASLERKRSAAKVGMTLSMGALIATGLMRGRGARTLHIWSGVALLGLSVWHHRLYGPAARDREA